MKEQSIIEVGESRPAWEALEAYARSLQEETSHEPRPGKAHGQLVPASEPR